MTDELGTVDILVGIPSWNNARTIGHVVRSAVLGIAEHFPKRRALVLNSDGGSADGTPAAVLAAGDEARAQIGDLAEFVAVRSVRYDGISGKGSAFRRVFAAAVDAEARAVVVLDADLRSVAPSWIAKLAGPILADKAAFLSPLYRRHKFDGTITNSIVCPLTAALYGGGIRQPIGGDFGFSGALAAHYLSHDVWESDIARFGIDLWMTTTALTSGYRLGQAHLGAKIHDPKDPGADLAGMLMQVVGTAFVLMEKNEDRWIHEAPLPDAPVIGQAEEPDIDPVRIDVERMERAYQAGVRDLAPIYAEFLPTGVAAELARRAGEGNQLPDSLWVRLVLSFALAHRRRTLPREQLLRSLLPLYLGRVATFVRAHEHSSPGDVEHAIERLTSKFRRRKPDLTKLWQRHHRDPEEVLP